MDENLKKKLNNFMLIILNQPTDEESFVIPNAEEITLVADTNNVRYYFNETVSIYTFETQKDANYLKDSIGLLFEDLEIEHILLPYQEDAMNIFLPNHVTKHIFPSYNIRKNIISDGILFKKDEDFLDKFKEVQEFLTNIDDEDDDDIADILIRQKQKNTISLDKILDKILECGVNSLTEEEKEILQKYSK